MPIYPLQKPLSLRGRSAPVAIRLSPPQNFLKIFSISLLTKAQNAIIMRLISNDKPVRKKSSTAQGILRELRVVRSKRCAAV